MVNGYLEKKCKKCKHFETVSDGQGHLIDRCDLNKSITWDRYNQEYSPGYYCGERSVEASDTYTTGHNENETVVVE